MSFHELDELREVLRIPQVQLCQRAELNPSTYLRWRRWKRGGEGGSKPNRRSLSAIRAALKSEVARHPLADGLVTRPAA